MNLIALEPGTPEPFARFIDELDSFSYVISKNDSFFAPTGGCQSPIPRHHVHCHPLSQILQLESLVVSANPQKRCLYQELHQIELSSSIRPFLSDIISFTGP